MNAARRLAPVPLLLLAAGLLSSCGDSGGAPSGPEEEPGEMRIVVLSGGEQRAFVGQALPFPVRVRVVDGDGDPAVGVPVRLAVTAGGGTLEEVGETTDVEGTVSATWRLGGTTGTQTVTATLPGAPGVRGETVSARALAPHEGDVVVVRGAEGRASSVVLFSPAGTESYRLAAGDSVLLLLPREALAADLEEVAAFAVARRPGLVTPMRWTAGRDSVEVRLTAPVRVPLAVWIVEGPFEAQADKVRASLERVREIWASSPIGTELGDVEIHDATGYAGDHVMSCADERRSEIGMTPGRTNVYYVRAIPGYSGYACAASLVLMSTTAPGAAMWPNLLAHEVGHTFFLFHNSLPGNVMVPDPPGSVMKEGQAYRAHFSEESSLSSVLNATPRNLLRPCALPQGRRCLSETFVVP